MTIEFRPAVRENVPLLIGLAGGTGSGKTYSAMRLAQGLANGGKFAVIDTENGRARHYADDFQFDAADLTAPFRPERYAEAIETAAQAGYSVVVVDSMTHEYAGDGGILDWQEEELTRLGGNDPRRREAMKMASWIVPKTQHKRMVTRLLQLKAHVILCFRAEEKIEISKDDRGKTVVGPKQSLVGLDGWIPITEKNLPFELTVSCLLTASHPGVPKPIKLPEQLRPFVPLNAPLDDAVGRRIGEWATGPGTVERALAEELLALADQLGMRSQTADVMQRHAGDVGWLQAQIANARHKVSESAPAPVDEQLFSGAEPEVPA